jgi:hypothetical protein
MTRARAALTVLTGVLGAALATVVITGRPRGALAASVLAAATWGALAVRELSPASLAPSSRARLVLVLLLLAAVVQFHVGGGRIAGDGVSYYVYVRSLMKDGDLDFTN